MRTFGLTGGIGMGKTTASEWFRAKRIPVVDSDQLARQVVEPGEPALAEIASRFGPTVLNSKGELERAALAQIVFADPEARKALESILHPRIRARWIDQFRRWREEGQALGVAVVPLLFEIQAKDEFEITICVACSLATQRERLSNRGLTSLQIDQRLSAQWPIDRKMALADFVVWSEGTLENLNSQLDRIVAELSAR